jgi:hypothetical protein
VPVILVEVDKFSEPIEIPQSVVDSGKWGPIVEAAIADLANRTRNLKNILEGLTGESGSLSAINDVDTTNLNNGFILRWNSTESTWEATALPENGITVTENGSDYQPQLLSTDQAEVGDIAEFTARTNCTLARDNAQAATGTHSLRLRSSAAGGMVGELTNTVAVELDGVYRAQAQFRAFSAGRSCRVGIEFLTAADAVVDTFWSATVDNDNTGFVTATVETTAPKTSPGDVPSTKARLLYDVQGAAASNEDHYVDAFVFQRRLIPRQKLNFSAGVVTDNPAADAINVDVAAIVSEAEQILTDIQAAQAELQDQALIYALALGG